MHDIEPHFQWRDEYIASKDPRSPFFRRRYDEFHYTHQVYNYYIHPQWDHFGSSTLYIKVIFVDYDEGYAIMELIGEWNDCLHNDVMYLKREVIDPLLEQHVSKFILIGEHVYNFHGDDDSYYEEWYEDAADQGGWIVLLNNHAHVTEEMRTTRLHQYLHFGGAFDDINWRPHKPERIYEAIEGLVQGTVKRIY